MNDGAPEPSRVNHRRRWYRLRLSTIVATMLVATVYLLFAYPGKRPDLAWTMERHGHRSLHYLPGHDSATATSISHNQCSHGFPYPCVFRNAPWRPPNLWLAWKDVVKVDKFLLTVDILCFAAFFLLLATLFEIRSRRRGRIFRWTLMEFLFLFACFGAGAAYLRQAADYYYKQQQFIADLKPFDATVRVRAGGPDWLREQLPEQHRIFDRISQIDLTRSLRLSTFDTRIELGWLPSGVDARTLADNTPGSSGLVDCLNRHAKCLATIELLVLDKQPEIQPGMLAFLQNARRLQYLSISRTKVTDSDIAVVTRMPRLQVFKAAGTSLTSEVLKYFAQLSNLAELDLKGTHVNVTDAEKLKAQNPKANIQLRPR